MDDRALLERLARQIPEPQDVMEGLLRRRQAKLRNTRLRAGALGLLVVAVFAIFAITSLRPTHEVVVPHAPSDPFEGVWTSTDVDGSDQTMTIESRGDAYRVVLVDEGATTSCGGERATLRGTGSTFGTATFVADMQIMVCEDGTQFDDPAPFTFRRDPTTGTMTDQADVTWTRFTG